MPTYGPNEIAAIIYFVGGWGPGSKKKAPQFLDVAIAVALAESGGNTAAQNKNSNGSYDVGLWQINTVHEAALKRYREFYSHDDVQLTYYDPRVNTAVARDIQTAQGWAPWVAYTSGSYKAHLGHGQAAYEWISKKENLDAFKAQYSEHDYYAGMKVGEDTSWQDILKSFPSYLVSKLKDMGIAVGVFILGLVVLILGVWFLLARSGVTKKIPGPAGVIAGAVGDVSK